VDDLYLAFLRRWWWLIAAGTIVSLLVTSYSLRKEPVLYYATSTVQVGRTIQDTRPSRDELDITDQLVPAYVEIGKRAPVLNKTIEALNLPFSTDQLQSMVLIRQVQHAPLIDVSVVDSNPERAAAIATEIGRQIVLQSPSPSQQDEATQAFIQTQLNDLKSKISDGQSQIESLQNQISHLASAAEVSDAQRQLDVLNEQVNGWQASYANLLQSVTPTNTNMVSLVNPAPVPKSPMSQPRLMYYGLGIAVGAGLSAIIALFLDLLRPSIRDPKDLGPGSSGKSIVPVPRFRMRAKEMHIVASDPNAPAAAAYRELRNAISSIQNEAPIRKLAVVSTRMGEGKTTTATNLAISLAAASQRVLLVDANLRNPELAERFSIAPSPGFSDLLNGTSTSYQAIQETKYRNLKVISAGKLTTNFKDLLASNNLPSVINGLATLADIVLFDCPAILEEKEALILLKQTDGVIPVVEIGQAKPEEYQEMLETLDVNGILVVATVGNKSGRKLLTRDLIPWSSSARRRRRAAKRRMLHSGTPETNTVVTRTQEQPGNNPA
jgi:succinoglycan biosynthesis transport protein ExoP